MLLVGKGPAAFVLIMAFVEASVATTSAPEKLVPSQCTLTSISGVDNLCLFNSFAHGTALSATVLRQQVCEFMRENRRLVMPDVNMTIENFVLREGSVMARGAGLAVAGTT
jgi:hypothetical protein